jgi:hypothetical protein
VTTFVLRDAQGRCIEVADGKPALLLNQVTDGAKFESYTDAEASAKKLFKDAEICGDTYFNSGDLTQQWAHNNGSTTMGAGSISSMEPQCSRNAEHFGN